MQRLIGLRRPRVLPPDDRDLPFRDHKAPGDRPGFGLHRLLLRTNRSRKAPGACRVAQSEWRQGGLLKNIQLTISGCLGPCDVPNVVLIATAEEDVWLGNIDRFEYYREIVEWAARSKAAGRMPPLSKDLLRHRLDPFRQ
jgi:hypothetical protein